MSTSNSRGNDNETHNETQTDNFSRQRDNHLYLQNYDSLGMKLVSEPFDGTGFSIWKRSVTIVLSAINKLGFLLGALSKTIGRSVIYATTAHQIWLELEERYGVSNGTQMFGLHKELNELSQENSNIAEYFTRFKMLWDDIDSLCLVPMCTSGCTCGASRKLIQFQQDQKVIQLLMGLNDSYAAMRGSILMRFQSSTQSSGTFVKKIGSESLL
ncbi:uncharacterized protein LOC141714373 [Apium graveolens]|uniref:uncharacterized protein LOC141714373 n=1 Tax=Apium graveolens TaxID=4045 RepID=UPI003D7A858B